MDRELLQSVISDVLNELGDDLSNKSVINDYLESHKRSSAAYKRLECALEQMDEFQLDRLPRFCIGSGFISLMPYNYAPLLIRVACEQGSSGEAVDWLDKVLSTRKAEGLHVLACWGLTPLQKLQVAEGVSLMPIEQLADSATKRDIMKPWIPGGHRMPPPSMWMPPTAVLVSSATFKPFVFLPGEDITDESAQIHIAIHARLLRQLELIGALTPCTVIPGPQWVQFNDPDLNYVRLGVSQMGRELVGHSLTSFGDCESPDVLDSVRAFESLEGEFEKKCWRAVQRINRAMAWNSPGDAAVELTIAAESLTMPQPDMGEHSYKVALRTAIMIAEDATDCDEVRARTKALYDLRSSIVHRGDHASKVRIRGAGKTDIKGLIADCYVIVARLLRAIIKCGSEPDWWTLELDGRRYT